MKNLLENGASYSEEAPNKNQDKADSEKSSSELLHISEDKYLSSTNDWIFEFEVKNTTEPPIFIKYLNIIDNGGENYICDENSRPDILEMLMGPKFKTTPLNPGEYLVPVRLRVADKIPMNKTTYN